MEDASLYKLLLFQVASCLNLLSLPMQSKEQLAPQRKPVAKQETVYRKGIWTVLLDGTGAGKTDVMRKLHISTVDVRLYNFNKRCQSIANMFKAPTQNVARMEF